MKKLIRVFTKYKYLSVLVLLGFVLRLWGIDHELPYIFNVDEPAFVRTSYGLRFDLSPGHFDWPHFYVYINGLFLAFIYVLRVLLNTLHLQELTSGIFSLLWVDPAIFYLTSRVGIAFFGALTAVPIYLVSKEFLSHKLALIAALIFLIIPFHVKHSQFALVDVPLVFLMVFVFLFSIKIAKYGRLKDYVLAGIFLGLSTSTKYNGLLLVINVILAHFIYTYSANKVKFSYKKFFNLFDKKLVIAGILTILFFILGTPTAVSDYKTFFKGNNSSGALWQFTNIGNLELHEYFPQVFENLSVNMPKDTGILLWVGFVLSILFLIFKSRKNYMYVLVWVFPLLYFFYVSKLVRQPSHYFLPIYPFITVATVIAISKLKKGILQKVLLILLVFSSLLFSLQIAKINATKDSRVYATDWIENVPVSGSKILLDGEYSPQNLRSDIIDFTPSYFLDVGWIEKKQPDYIIVSRYPDNMNGLDYLQDINVEFITRFEGTNNPGPEILIYKLTHD